MADIDILSFDDVACDRVANLIEGYCESQNGVLETFLKTVYSFEAEWTDDKTFDPLIQEVQGLYDYICKLMDSIYGTCPKKFRDRAELIRRRGALGGITK